MKILVLDDNSERLSIFKTNLDNSSFADLTYYVKTAKLAILLISIILFDYIFLDHDLGVLGYPLGTGMIWDDSNNGMNVVDFIINNKIQKRANIVVHSWNIPRAIEMHKRLIENEYAAIMYPGVWNMIGK